MIAYSNGWQRVNELPVQCAMFRIKLKGKIY
ncbi:hypothetical protein Golax_001658 [Gossypium laxum]|uniref:Uncharacterized protein n=1 Tax=Gossypium laxum TaxID=34288 RepID=A0A7J9AXG6_9ROSI|nr:hypothetical protein [Gossypium laxum]